MPQDLNTPKVSVSPHGRHCFVVMPSGRDSSEQKWFRGWYEVVIKAAIIDAGYEPVLAATEEQPGAINDEIRAHLANDPMVVVDLGGAEPEADPNPNVMYELGIRHALGLPLVMMAWKGQRLPFDVGNQRVIMEDRDLVDLELNRKKVVSFLQAAEQGKYYRPMDAVTRLTTIQNVSDSLGEDSLLRALAIEVRDLRTAIASSGHARVARVQDSGPPTVKTTIRSKVFRKELYPHYLAAGGDPNGWERVLQTIIPPDALETFQKFSFDDWRQYVEKRSVEFPFVPKVFDEELLEKVRQSLPPQPWPSGTHLDVASRLEIAGSTASDYITELIRRKIVVKQINGELFPATSDGGG
jgi:hypothetical protein